MEPTHPRHYGPAKEAFANDAARKQQKHSTKASSSSHEVDELEQAGVHTEDFDVVSKYDGTDTSDSRADAIAAFMLVMCIAGGMLLWVSTR
ncbi:hypothetical protein [Allohahella sp. A8]|uniref:hypothetical protein n=1 Tax=Allohahella sp. A8 TaxID=3141461 RepID=UPI000C0A82CB|nr:hypothetical protein [Hahellaceae bacterium]